MKKLVHGILPKFIFPFLISSFISFVTQAEDFKKECTTSVVNEVRFSFCIHTPIKNVRLKLLIYHLHGGGGSQDSWSDPWYYTQQIRQEWSQLKTEWPTVVSVSFGPSWLLANKNTSPQSGLLQFFESVVVPEIESKTGVPDRRIVFGESMGGFNSVQLAFHTSLFSKAAILCAPMTEISIFAPQEEIHANAMRSTVWQYYLESQDDPKKILNSVDRIVKLGKMFYPSELDWKAADPLQLSKSTRFAPLPELYVAAGFYDIYALYEGNIAFVNELKKQGAKVDWRPQWGGHCATDIKSLAEFLIN